MTRRGSRGVLLAAVLALVGCSTTTAGHPSADVSTAASSSSPAFPSTTPTTTPTVPPTPTPPSSPPAPEASGCSVTDRGAPFCYPLPAGFADFSDKRGYASGWHWRTLVSVGRHDLIEVLAQPVRHDLDRVSRAAARRYVAGFAPRSGAHGVRRASPLAATRVDGAPAFRQSVTYRNGVGADAYNILRGHTVVYLSCQYTVPGRAAVRAACRQVLAGIRIDNV